MPTVNEIIKDNSIWIPSRNYEESAPVLSILMPTFGRGKNGFFKRAVNSFCDQTLKEIELIIVDDANTDGTEHIIEEFMQKDERISCIRHKYNIGLPAISIYEAYKKARGEYIGFLFDDCLLYPSAYERTLQTMTRRKAMASYGRVFAHTDKKDKTKGIWLFFNEVELDNIKYTNAITNLSMICKKEVFETVGWYDPHISMTRICDWDLLNRIKRSYELIETGVKFGEEFGVTQENSLGNSYKMDFVLVNEYLYSYSDRTEKLKLHNYGKYDVLCFWDNISSYSKSLIRYLSKKYENKKWWSEKQEWLNDIEVNIAEPFKDSIGIIEQGALLSASSTLLFNNIPFLKNNLFTYRNNLEILAQVRAVILVRYSNNAPIVEKLLNAKIPYYILWDDNFLLIPERKLSESDFKNFISKAEGLIVTSPKFYQEFSRKKYIKSVEMMEPLYHPYLEKKISKIEKKVVNIAFAGGQWRLEKSLSFLLPALNALSAKYDITLYLPKHDNIRLLKQFDIEFNTKFIEFTASYEQMIHKYGKNNIHIQIHSSAEHANNQYKTKNALITASLLGAVLIASDDLPYSQKDNENDTMPYLLCANEPNAWQEALESMIESDDKRIKLIEDARKYCVARYSETALRDLQEFILKKTDKVDMLTFIDRVSKLSGFDFIMGGGLDMHVPSAGIGISGQGIVASEKIRSKKRFYFMSNVENINEIGVYFGTHFENPRGLVEVIIKDKKEQILSKDTISLDSILDNGMHLLKVDTIENAYNKEFIIEFNFNYAAESSLVSVYMLKSKGVLSNIPGCRKLIQRIRKQYIYINLIE